MPTLDEDFLLTTQWSRKLYHDHAKKMPIYDYHCHLPVRDIAEDVSYPDAAALWLGGDHYKWRLMRSWGIDEELITGGGEPYQKFLAFARSVERAIGNPMQHWCALELKRYFDIEDSLTEEQALGIWERMNRRISSKDFSARRLIERSGVTHLSTTDDPADDLCWHRQLQADSTFAVNVTPAFRPDKALNLGSEGFTSWLERLEGRCGLKIESYLQLLEALTRRIDAFHATGCRISDHALDTVIFTNVDEKRAEEAFRMRLEGKQVPSELLDTYRSTLMTSLAAEYRKRDWVMQLHIGALRNTNSRAYENLGPDTGFDAISDSEVAIPLSRLLDTIEQAGGVPKTILYCLNPRDNELLASLAGCYQSGGIRSKIQFGSGWWFNDQRDGMLRQLTALSHLGHLGAFVGMLTDSRSFISYPRHEYFRRILCDLVGSWVEQGLVAPDLQLLGSIIEDICYNNAVSYFGIPERDHETQ